MSAKKRGSKADWIDPDDAPELTDELIDSATYKIGDRVVTPSEGQAAMKAALKRGRPKADETKERISIRLSPEVVNAFRATGRGWQTRIDEALKEWMREHSC